MYRTLDYNGPFLTENVHNNNGLKLMYFALRGRYTHTPIMFYRQLPAIKAIVSSTLSIYSKSLLDATFGSVKKLC